MKAVLIGNLTLDLVEGKIRVGGPGLYGGRALSECLGVETYVLSYVNEDHRSLVLSVLGFHGIKILELKAKEMPMFVIRSGKAVEFRGTSNRIPNEVVEGYVKTLEPDMVVLAPVMGELGEGVIAVVKDCKKAVLSLDLQGFVRKPVNSGITCNWSRHLEQLLPHAHVVHGNVAEYCFSEDEQVILKNVADLSTTCETSFLISLDARGTYTVHRGEVFYIPSIPVTVVDDVGAGDILLAITTYYRRFGLSAINAAVKGVVAASLKVGNAYGKWFSKEEIEAVSQDHIKNVKALSI